MVDLSVTNASVTPANDSSQPNQGVTLSWPVLPDIDEYQVQVDTSENFAGLLYLDRVFLDRVFLDRVFLDRVFLDRVFLDRVFLDRVFLDRVFLDRVFLDRVFLDRVFLDRVFLDRVFLDRVFLDRVFLDRVFLDRVFLDRYSLDKVFLDRVFLDRLLFDKVTAAPVDSTVSLTLADPSGEQRISEGTHYWRVRARLADGTFGPWSVGRKFNVHTQDSKVVINEIKLTDPSWVEFHNTGTHIADMTNWKFFAYGPDGATQLLYTFPNGFTLQPNGYVVLYEGQGANTGRTLFTGGSQIDWPLVAQTTLDDPNLLNQMGAVVPAEDAVTGESSPPQPDQPTIIIGPNGPMMMQGSSLTPLNIEQPAPTNTVEQNGSMLVQGMSITSPTMQPAATSTPEANVSAQTVATPEADVSAQSVIAVNTTSMAVNPNDGLCSLVEAITAANTDTTSGGAVGECAAGAGADSINLGTSQTYTLTAVNNGVQGPNGLPDITTNITINGNSSTITRDSGAPNFRIFHIAPSGTLTLQNLTVSGGNSGGFEGGGIYNSGDLFITNSNIINNTATEQGGGVFNAAGSGLTVSNSTFSGNAANANWGGGGIANYGVMNVDGSFFTNNTAGGTSNGGGGILNRDTGTATIDFTEISGNSGTYGGGLLNHGTATLTHSSIHGNTGGDDGGGIYTAGTLTVTNTSVGANHANGDGGGLYNDFGATSTVTYDTFNANTADGLGGNIRQQTGAVDLGFSIVEGGSASSGPNLSGTINSQDYNVIQSTTGATITGTTTHNTIGVSANLGALTGTPGYYQPNSGSPAIDKIPAGSCLVADDQRLIARPQGANCDAGAIEVQASDTPQTGPTFTVNSIAATDDGVCGTADCSLIEAINAANAQAGANTINLGSGQTYTLTAVNVAVDGDYGLPDVTTEIVINGNNSTITRSGAAPDLGIFHVATSGNLSLNNVTISNGRNLNGGSGGVFNRGILTVNGSTFSNHTASGGSAIRNIGASSILTVTNSVFTNNSSTSGSGAINSTANATISGSTFSSNTSSGNGGALFNSGTMTISSTFINNNTANNNAGGIYNTGTLTLNPGTNISGNTSPNGNAGAILSETTGSLTISSATFDNNSGLGVGAIMALGPLSISNSFITNNTSGASGGGVFATGVTTISNTMLSGNTADAGGGMILGGSQAITIANSTFSGNSAPFGGGMRVLAGPTVTITNSTFASNSASLGGGAIESPGTATINIAFSTFTGNSDALVRSNGASTVTVKNSIIANSTLRPNCANFFGSTLGVNFADDASCTGFMQVTSPQLNLGVLAANGGQTQTVALGAGSIAIDAAIDCILIDGTTAVTADQRGVVRPKGAACDAGAFEVIDNGTTQTGPTFTVNTTEMNDDGVCGTNNCTLIDAINAANADGVASTINLGINQTYTMTSVNNTVVDIGANGLPAISSRILINGNNSTITRLVGAPEFRLFYVDPTGELTGSDVTLSAGNPGSSHDGGAIYNRNAINLNSFTLEDNQAANGGAIYNSASASLSLVNSTLHDNQGITGGGAVYNAGSLIIFSTSFSNNTANLGGAVINLGTMTVNPSTFTSNHASGNQGGAIANFATLTVDQTTFTGNSAATNGGAIDNAAFGTATSTLTITNSTLNNNTAVGYGGAVLNYADVASSTANLTIRNSTISGNAGNFAGGGVANLGGGGTETATVDFSTVVSNSSAQGANLYNGLNKTFNVKNAIVAQPLTSTNCNGVFITAGVNFADDASCAGFTQVTAGQLNLGALANNSGPTQTIALGTGSVAINTATDCTATSGATVTTDQRGISRPKGAQCDVGAFEAAGAGPTPTPGPTITPTPPGGDPAQPGPNFVVNNSTDLDDGICGVNNCSLREAVNAANAQPSASEITFNFAEAATTITLAGTELLINSPIAITTAPGKITISGNNQSRIFNVSAVGALTATWLTLINGSGGNNGGAILNNGTINLSLNSIYSNSAANGGAITNQGIATISGSSFYGNTAFDAGGAIVNSGGVMTLTDSLVFGNSTSSGLDGALGGGVYNSGSLTVSGSSFQTNSTTFGKGGAIANLGELIVNASTFSDTNQAALGGAIYTTGLSVMTLTNVTVSGNSATSGGGIYIDSPTTINFTTIANNTNSGIFSNGVSYAIKNSIITNPTTGVNCAGTAPNASGVNFANDASCSGFTNTATPLIDGLGYNIGRVSTHALKDNSPARDAVTDCTTVAGVPVTEDARFIPRPQGDGDDPNCDAGAYEFGGDLHVTTTQIIEDANDGLCSLPEAINAANSRTPSGGINGECIPSIDGPEIITLGANQTYKLTQVHNTTQGPNGLPVITDPSIYLYMNSSTIIRASDASDFRILYIAPGAGLYFPDAGTISGGHLSGTDKGAGILNRGSLTYGGPTFENNVAAGDGGAIYNDVGAGVYMFNSVIRNNRAGRGGAFYNAGSLTTNNNFMRFEGNQATQGGAVYNAGGSVDLSYATFLNNHADTEGGSVYNAAGSFTSVNPTMSGGQATQGSAIFQASGAVDINFATVAENTTTDNDYSALVYSDGSMTVSNSIVANNIGNNCTGLEISGSNNLEYPGNDCGAGFNDQNPLLAAKVDDTFLVYYPLLTGSPAIDAINPPVGCPYIGANGVTRPIGPGCEIGSWEGVGIALAGNLTVTTTSMATNPTDGLCSLPEAIIAANTDTAAPGSVQGECVPAGGADTITLGGGLTYTISAINNSVGGENGLPVILSPITIDGNGSTITRNANLNLDIPAFRLFYIDPAGSLTLNKLTLSNGSAGAGGGAIYADGTLTLNYVSIADNVGSSGGGLFLNGPTTINNSSITGNNTANSNDGGGILVDGSLVISNTTIANNKAAQFGGGIVTSARAGASPNVTIYNSTIANNVANTSHTVGDGGGIRVFGDGTVTVYNTIIANNVIDLDGINSQTSNCFGNVQAGSATGTNLQWPGVTCTPAISSADPLLGPLTGSPGYLPLGAGSPAIDAGDDTICQQNPVNGIDQRGVARPATACDIGAIEATEVPALVAGTTGGAASLVSPAGTQDFVRFGDTTIGPIEGIEWRGDNVLIPSSATFNIGRDPLGSDTNHVTDWLSQGSSAGGQNFAKAVINEVYTGTNDLVELYNPIIDTVDLSGWELTLYDGNDQVITLPTLPNGGTTFTYRFPNGTLLRPGQFLVIAETNPNDPGSDDIYAITLGANSINWDDWNATGAVALSNGVTSMDFVRFGGSGISPLTVDPPTGTAFTGIVPAPLPGESIGRNADSTDTDTAGDWYSQGASVGDINPTLTPPDNDLFTNAILINPLPFRDTGNTLSATAANDPLTSCGFSVGHSVWYKYTAANSNPVRFQTDGSDFDTVLAVFTLNTSTNTLQQVSGQCSRKDNATGSRLTLNPTANTIYYVMIGGHLNDSGSYVFSANAPVNDDIDDAINIGAIADLPFRTYQLNGNDMPISNTNVTAASQLVSDPTTTCAITVGRSVWYKYTAADATRLRLRTTGTQFDTVIAIYTGSVDENNKVVRNSLQEVACNNDDTSDTTSDMGFTPVPGTTYFIEVAGNSDAGGSLLFEVNVFPAPANDLVENAYIVTPDTDPLRLGAFLVTTPDGTVAAPFAQDTTGATATDDATASCGLNLGGSVWFVYTDDITSETPETVVFQTFASDYDTAMTIYTADPNNEGSFIEEACSDDVGVNEGSRLTLGGEGDDVALVEGQTYTIRISGYFGETGNLTFNAFTPQVATPQNDDPTTPYTIKFTDDNYIIEGVTDPLNITPFLQDTTGTTQELEAAAQTLTCGEEVGHTVWYRYVAPERQRVVFDSGGSDFDTLIAAFVEQTDGDLNSLIEVGCNDDFDGRPESKLTLNTGDGIILYVMFGGYKQDRGNLKLGIQQIVPVVTDFTLVNAGLSGDIRQLTDPDTLNLSSLPPIAVRANTEPSEVGSVLFELRNFNTNALVYSNTDNMFPYSLTGNEPDSSYTPWTPTPGTYKLTATPYTEADGQGRVGTPLTITLTVIGANAAPVIAADNASVTVSEGLTAINSGTFSDPEGDTVTLTASVGTVTADLSVPAHPTWNWSFVTSDGPADSQIVTITADDGHGHTTPVTFALVVNNVAPTATFTPAFLSQNVRRLTFSTPVDVNADLNGVQGIVYSYDCTFDNDGNVANDDFDVSGVTATSYNCTFPGPGTYMVRGRIADKDGGFTDYTAAITISQDNLAPVVNAGNDQTITLPTNSVSLLGIASDDGLPINSTLTFAWTAINNPPAPVIFSAPNALSTNATFSIAGTYTLQLTASDGALSGSDPLTVVVEPAANVAPNADAGTDQVVQDNAPYGTENVTLHGEGSSDSDGSIVGYAWTEGATLLANTVTPTIALADGVHIITLTVTDDKGATDTDEVIITVQLPTNQAPTVNAGADQTITLPVNSVALTGTASDDGLPLPANLTYTWTAINNPPAPVIFSAPNALSTTATFSAVGTYTLQLTASDGALSSSDTLTVVVQSANVAPVVNAGSDQSITLPTNSVSLLGIVTDDGLPLPPTLTYTWTAINNPPAPVIFSAPNALSTNATFSAAGTYTLQLTASDGQLSGSDTLQVVVSPQSTGNTLTDQVEKSSDDVNEDGNSYDATNSQLWFGTGQNGSKSYMGVRFTNLDIPKGATITDAHLEVYTLTAQWISMHILIGADAVDNSATFTSATRPSTRSFTTARLDYRSDIPWMAGTWNDIGDVKAVVQEIVNRTGWQSGSSLSILIKGVGGSWGRKFVTSYDGDPAHAPRLIISYAGGPPPPNNPPFINLDNPSAAATAAEGQAATLITGTFGDPDNNPVTLTPSVGLVQTNGNTWTWSYTPPDGPISQTVTITAKDSKGAFALVPVTFGLTVSNVAPTASFAAQPATTFPNNPVALTFSSPVDVAADLASLTYSVDCGNGGVIQTAAPFSCTYASVGTYTALGTVADKDGGSTTYQAVITVNSTPTQPTTITKQVNGSSDDVNQSRNTLEVNNAQIWIGTEGNTGQSYTGLRFNNLDIPVGATITEAHLEFYTTASQWISIDVLIAADAADNSVTFSNGSKPSTRNFTTARVTHHSNEQWLANSWNMLTGNLSGVVQEVVSRAGWHSGNSLSIILKGLGGPWGRKFVTSYDGNPAFAPRLVVSYTPPVVSLITVEEPPLPLNLTIPNPPSAAFAANAATGDAPLAVQFTDTSTGDIAGYAWNFGDGATSADQNPAHTYSTAGAYTVILVVTGTDTMTSTAQIVITVTTPPAPPTDVPTDTPPPPTEEATSVPTEVVTTPPPSDTPPPEVAGETTPPADQPAAP